MMSSPDGGYCFVQQNIVIKHGYVKMKSRKFGGLFKKRYVCLFAPSSKGPTRFVKYADEKMFREEKLQSQIKMQDVTTVVRLSTGEDHGITLTITGSEVRQFLCQTANEAEDWLQKLQAEAGKSDILAPGHFRAYLIPSAQLDYEGECLIEITMDSFNVYEDEAKQKIVLRLKIAAMRRYTINREKKDNLLLVENGHSQEATGECILLFRSFQCEELHNYLDGKARRLRGSLASSSSQSSNGSFNIHPNSSTASRSRSFVNPRRILRNRSNTLGGIHGAISHH